MIYNSTASLNGFDQYGHFGRTRVTLSTCLEYKANPAGESTSGCAARFHGPGVSQGASTSAADLFRLLEQGLEEQNGGTAAEPGPAIGVGQGSSTGGGKPAGEAGISESSKTGAGTEPLLDYLLGP